MVTVYIASSWRHRHAVDMLAARVRALGMEVWSFVENVAGDERLLHGRTAAGRVVPDADNFEAWMTSEDADRKFEAELSHATKSDLVIYLGPAGTDAWAEVGAAWQAGRPVYGLTAKGEPAGLMRKMIYWCDNVEELLVKLAAEKASIIRMNGSDVRGEG